MSQIITEMQGEEIVAAEIDWNVNPEEQSNTPPQVEIEEVHLVYTWFS